MIIRDFYKNFNEDYERNVLHKNVQIIGKDSYKIKSYLTFDISKNHPICFRSFKSENKDYTYNNEASVIIESMGKNPYFIKNNNMYGNFENEQELLYGNWDISDNSKLKSFENKNIDKTIFSSLFTDNSIKMVEDGIEYIYDFENSYNMYFHETVGTVAEFIVCQFFNLPFEAFIILDLSKGFNIPKFIYFKNVYSKDLAKKLYIELISNIDSIYEKLKNCKDVYEDMIFYIFIGIHGSIIELKNIYSKERYILSLTGNDIIPISILNIISNGGIINYLINDPFINMKNSNILKDSIEEIDKKYGNLLIV